MATELLYQNLTYALNGIFFSVHNELGRHLNEQLYGDAVEARLQQQEIPYRRELVLASTFEGEQPGRNRVDFFVADAVVVELKVKVALGREDYAQILRYCTSLNCKLGILVNFRQRSLVPKRVINPNGALRKSVYPQSAKKSVNP